MKKTIKKALAFIIALVMLATVAPVTFASEKAIKLDETNTVHIETSNREVVVSFTPDESGLYVIKSDNSSGMDEYDIDPYVYICNSEGNKIAEGDDSDSGYNFVCEFEAEAGETYSIKLFACNDDVEYDYVIRKCMKILHQPTAAEPYVEVSWADEYQWYSVETTEEITDKNASSVDEYADFSSASAYDSEKGWTGNYWGEDAASFFNVELKKGDIILVDFGKPVDGKIGIRDNIRGEGLYYEDGVETNDVVLVAPWNGIFEMSASGIDSETTVRAYFCKNVKIDSETKATLQEPENGKIYCCEVTLANGDAVTSNFFKIDYDETITEHTDENGDGICDDCEEVLVFCEKCGEAIHTNFFAKLICEIKAFFAKIIDFFALDF